MLAIEAQALSGTEWNFVTMLGSPAWLAKDEKNRHRWVCNAVAEKAP